MRRLGRCSQWSDRKRGGVNCANCGFDVVMTISVRCSDSRFRELILRAISDLGAEHDVYAFQRSDDAVEGGFFAPAADAILLDLAMPNNSDPFRRGFKKLEFPCMAEVFIDTATPLVATATRRDLPEPAALTIPIAALLAAT